MFYEVSIKSANGGFGMYEANHNDIGDKWASLYDLEDECRNNVGDIYQLGRDDLPNGMTDIRGNIANEPKFVYGFIMDSEVYYFGINED